MRPAERCRAYGVAPYAVALVHGGPGAAGTMAPVARALAPARGVIEPVQTALSVEGQAEELSDLLRRHAALPAVLVGHSWGAWLSLIVAAREPSLVRKLILVSSGPFEERFVPEIQTNRLARLGENERRVFLAALRTLNDPAPPAAASKQALRDLGALVARADAFDPIAGPEDASSAAPDAVIFRAVWAEAAALRRDGTLLETARRVRCPVTAIHGESDPHPAAGVREPLSAALEDFRFVLLPRCGHTPWLERQARERFFEILTEESG